MAVVSSWRELLGSVLERAQPSFDIFTHRDFLLECLSKTASDRLEEGEDDVKSARPLWAGLHTCYNGDHNGRQRCESERILKNRRSSDWCLQFDTMKMESLVIADQNAAVNLYPGLVHTARHTLGIVFPRSR